MKSVYKIVLVFFVLTSCKPEFSEPEYTTGEVDPYRFVAIGDEFTAGYADGAYYYEAQKNSYAFILAEHFRKVSETNFVVPFVNQSSVGYGLNGKSRTALAYATDCLGASSLKPVPVASFGDSSIFQINLFPTDGPFNNMGIPEMKMIDVNKQGYGNSLNGNRYYNRIASDPSVASVLDDAYINTPTFFSIFLGINDVLAYAMKGGASNFISPVNGLVNVGFESSLRNAVTSLKSNGANGIISTIPDITDFPYFTTIPANGLNLDSSNAATLNSIYNPLGISFQVGSNYFTMEDTAAGIFAVRKIKSSEKILLSIPLDSVKCYKLGSVYPIPNRFILNENEISAIQTTVANYNVVIRSIAQEYDLALVDAYSFFKSVKSGISYNGISMNMQFVSGGFFSLDGIHLNPRGNALLANEFIKSINLTFKSNFPLVDVTKYSGILFP